MASPTIDKNHTLNGCLYKALMEGDERTVIELCKRFPEGPLHILTIHKDTVLHMATYSKQKQLVLELLKELPNSHIKNMTSKNDSGNTILHEAATSNKLIPAAEEMLRKAPKLFNMRNTYGETALFRAALYGKSEMFKFLDGDEVNRIVKSAGEEEEEEEYGDFCRRKDKSTILHISIRTEYFDLALHIAKEHENLVNEKDGNGMTALQLLACNPSAFGNQSKHYLKRLIYSCVSSSTDGTHLTEQESCFRVPLVEAIRREKQRYELAVKLAKFLIARDTSWEDTEPAINVSNLKPTKYGPVSSSYGQAAGDEQKTMSIAETPLFLATKYGILEIVEEILNQYPQAVEHIDEEGRNILHLAIKYRQVHIFDFVEKLEIPMRRLIRKINNDGNSILHMVGKNPDDHAAKDMHSPALLLQQDLLLFERVKKISTIHFTKHFNNDRKTAETLFAENNDTLRTEGKEWLKRTAENCSIVAVLISTVAFAAAYTVPGGPNQNTGYPLLLNQSFFVIFALADVLSLTFALTSVITFLSILTSSFRFEDFKQSLPQKLVLGFTLLILSVSMMMLAFAATVILLIRNRQQWTKIALYSVAFLPVCIFALSYLPLYIELMKTFLYSIKKIGEVFPRFNGVFLRSWVAKSFSSGKTQSPFLSNPTDQSLASSLTKSSIPQTTLDPV